MSDLKNSLGKPAFQAKEQDWPRDFDFREAYAEQQELLDPAYIKLAAQSRANGTDCHE